MPIASGIGSQARMRAADAAAGQHHDQQAGQQVRPRASSAKL